MRALVIPGAGMPAVLAQVPAPRVTAGHEVLVRVEAAGVTGFDQLIAAGALEAFMEHHFPVTLGREFTGIVETVGADVEGFAAGDAVIGMITGSELHEGAVAEYVVVPADRHLAHRPANLEPAAAAGVAMSAQVALGAVGHIDPQPGQHVVIVGASGGIGMYALQLAAARGAHVTATGHPDDEQLLRDLGADAVVDFRHDLLNALTRARPQGFDAMIDVATLDPAAFAALTPCVRDGGRVAVSTMIADPLALAERGIEALNVMVDLFGDRPLQQITAMLTDGSLRPATTQVTAMDEADELIAAIPHQYAPGRYVVTL